MNLERYKNHPYPAIVLFSFFVFRFNKKGEYKYIKVDAEDAIPLSCPTTVAFPGYVSLNERER